MVEKISIRYTEDDSIVQNKTIRKIILIELQSLENWIKNIFYLFSDWLYNWSILVSWKLTFCYNLYANADSDVEKTMLEIVVVCHIHGDSKSI